MKSISVFCIAFLLIYSNQIEAQDSDPVNPEEAENLEESGNPENAEKFEKPERPSEEDEKTMPIIRAKIPLTNLSPRLKKLEKSLQMDGDIERIDPTKKEKLWIDRFVTTVENWLSIVTEVSKLKSYRNGYKDMLKHVWDDIIPGNYNTPIQVRYRKNVEETHPEAKDIYAYNFIPYWICISGFGLGTVNINLLNIYFQRSNKPKKTPNGEKVLRKDRFYDVEVEVTAPWVYLRVDHEIIQWGEETDPEEKRLQVGVMRVQLHNVKITLSMQLQEIDKRFVQKNPETGLTYYFCLPKLKLASLSVETIQRYNNEIQKKTGPEGEYVGKGINNDRAQKIIIDLTDLFETPKGCEEIFERLKPVLVNRCAEAVMTSPDILSIAKNVSLAWHTAEPTMPIAEWKADEVKLWHEAFYIGYSPIDMVKKALDFIIVHMQNCRQDNRDKEKDPNLLGDGPPEDYDVGGLNVHDDGFDFTGISERKSS